MRRLDWPFSSRIQSRDLSLEMIERALHTISNLYFSAWLAAHSVVSTTRSSNTRSTTPAGTTAHAPMSVIFPPIVQLLLVQVMSSSSPGEGLPRTGWGGAAKKGGSCKEVQYQGFRCSQSAPSCSPVVCRRRVRRRREERARRCDNVFF